MSIPPKNKRILNLRSALTPKIEFFLLPVPFFHAYLFEFPNLRRHAADFAPPIFSEFSILRRNAAK